jgi:pimeloyl-ACP methyl ester carboxylesterase
LHCRDQSVTASCRSSRAPSLSGPRQVVPPLPGGDPLRVLCAGDVQRRRTKEDAQRRLIGVDNLKHRRGSGFRNTALAPRGGHLHGGAGPQSALPFAERFAASNNVRVVTPTHPGFGGTARPAGLDGIPNLAVLYGQLLAELDLADVTVIGNSIGGWIAAELALLRSPRVSGIVLIDAVGIDVPGHPVADAFSLSLEQIMQRSFHDPVPFVVDPTTLPEAARVVMRRNRAALAAYTNGMMSDPSLIGRLHDLELATLVLWGDSDRIADLDYGRACAAAIPSPGSKCSRARDTCPNWRRPTKSPRPSGNRQRQQSRSV